MAKETYYFFFSIILVLGTLFFMANLIFFRMKSRTLFGQEFKPGTDEHARVMVLASNRNIGIAAAFAVLSIANLVYDVYRLINLSDQEYARGILVYAPISTILFSIVMFLIMKER